MAGYPYVCHRSLRTFAPFWKADYAGTFYLKDFAKVVFSFTHWRPVIASLLYESSLMFQREDNRLLAGVAPPLFSSHRWGRTQKTGDD
jgi:hypothetical protein